MRSSRISEGIGPGPIACPEGPFQPADEYSRLKRGERPYTVVEILRNVFHEDFTRQIQYYLDTCPEGVAEAIQVEGAWDFRLIRLSEPKIESCLRQAACNTAVDLLFTATVEGVDPAAEILNVPGSHRKCWTGQFRMRYSIRLFEKTCSVPIIAPAHCFPYDELTAQERNITNQYLLPIMRAEDYAEVGRQMLERYYPEALDEPTAVNGRELAKRMKLDVHRVRYEAGSEIMGEVFFDWTDVVLRDRGGNSKTVRVPPMTILINTDKCGSPEIENSTMVHECCHVYLDLLYFRLQMLSGSAVTSHARRVRGNLIRPSVRTGAPSPKGEGKGYAVIEMMERQAEKLPAFVLMEEKNTRREIARLMAARGGVRSPENIYRVICQLAERFQVTRAMARNRMIELGYPEAEGVYTYLEGKRIPNYGCGGAWKHGVTYVIPMRDAGALLMESEGFRRRLESGRYIYTEGHYCLNAEQYIIRDVRQEAHLTEYARHHIEECCLPFSVRASFGGAAFQDAQAARKAPVKDRYQSRYEFKEEPDTKAGRKENDLFAEDAGRWGELAMNLPDNIAAAVQTILDLKGITQMELAMRLGISRTALWKWCSEKMSLRHVVAICIALDVPGCVGEDLVRLAGYSFRYTEEHKLLRFMLYNTRDLTVARANEIMRQRNLAPLTEGRNEELAS